MKQGFSFTRTGMIIVACIALSVLFWIMVYISQPNISYFALQPSSILAGKNLWTIVTSMFVHAGVFHLFVNMVSLLFIGSFVERLIGKKRFLWLYFISGIFAAMFFVLIAFVSGNDLNVYAVGASGAIFALGGLLAVLTPKLKVLVFFIIPMPMWIAMIFMLGILWIISMSANLPIGNVAHLGGLLVGLAYGLYLKLKYPKKTQMISRYFSR